MSICFLFKFPSDKQNRDLRDSIIHSVAQLVTGQITDRLTAIVMNEMPRHILPVLLNQLEKMKAQLLADVGQKLRGCDQIIKESIMNVTSTKVTFFFVGHYMDQKHQFDICLCRHPWKHSEMLWL